MILVLSLVACTSNSDADGPPRNSGGGIDSGALAFPARGPRPQTRTFVTLSVWENTGCALDEQGEVACWGSDDDGVLRAPSGPFEVVSVGESAACAIPLGGGLECWGLTSGFADAFESGFEAVSISVGRVHICGLDAAGALECWGEKSDGQANPPPGVYGEVDVASNLSCALDEAGEPSCWGADMAGTSDVPDVSLSGLSAGDGQVCGLLDEDGDGVGEIVAWGWERAYSPPGGEDFVQVRCNGWGSCARTREGALDCSGYPAAAERVGPYVTFADSRSGVLCAIRPEGTIECWDPWFGESRYDPSAVQESGVLRPPR